MKPENTDILTNKFETNYLLKRFKDNSLSLNDSEVNLDHIEYILLGLNNTIHIDSMIEDSWKILNSEILRTIIEYMNDEFAICNPKYYPDLKEKYYSQLHRKYQRRIENYKFDSIIIRPSTKEQEAEDLIKYLTK